MAYNEGAAAPETWLRFLGELLYPEDIPTLQEFMGYCLLPTTKGQKLLMLIGRGGEGKSRIGLVLRALFGTNMATGSMAKVETSRFARADLEHELVMLDDDMKLEALPQTNYIKAIVTAELPMATEARAFSGGRSSSQLGRRTRAARTIRSSPRRCAPRRRAYFSGALRGCGGSSRITTASRWLIANNYCFTLSERARENMDEAVSDGNNVVDFMRSEGYIRFRADSEASSRDLYAVYRLWCEDNALNPLSARSFSLYVCENLELYGLEQSNNIYLPGGRRVRGFVGVELLQRAA